MNQIEILLLSVALGGCFISLILILVFGQVTMRKLRKNQNTKEVLGFEYASGSNILNVVKVLSIPKNKARELKDGQMSFLYADADLLHKHTNSFDRKLAKCIYYFTSGSALLLVSIVGLHFFGVFD